MRSASKWTRMKNTMKRGVIIFCHFLAFCVTAEEIKQAPEAQKVTPTTMVAVTQDRDKAVYDWKNRHAEVLEQGKEGASDIAVIGDSIVHYWGGRPQAPFARGQATWDELFRGKKVVNLGFGWDRVENALWRVTNGELLAHKPKIVILMIGTNNLELNNASEIRKGIQLICKEILGLLPDCTVHVIGILPRKPPVKPATSAQQVNAQLHQHLAGLERVHFHDISQAFLDDKGQLIGNLFSDGLHPNEKGYARLARELSNVLAR